MWLVRVLKDRFIRGQRAGRFVPERTLHIWGMCLEYLERSIQE